MGVANVVSDDEHTQRGIEVLCENWQDSEADLLRRPPDVVILAEPTSRDAVVVKSTSWRGGNASRGATSPTGLNPP